MLKSIFNAFSASLLLTLTPAVSSFFRYFGHLHNFTWLDSRDDNHFGDFGALPSASLALPVQAGTYELFNYAKRLPIILVPGRMVSKLEAKIDNDKQFGVINEWCYRKWDYFQLWFKLSNFKPYMIDCWFHSIRLNYNIYHRRTYDTPGVTVKPQYFGLTEPVEFLWTAVRNKPASDYFHSMVEFLTGLGYRRNVDLFAASYDWRKSVHENEDFLVSMKRLIEETVKSNHGKPAALICHSLGCIYSYYFLRLQDKVWKKTFIKGLITMGAPFGGEVRVLYTYLGFDDNLLVKTFPIIRYSERTFSSTSLLLPQPGAFKHKGLLLLHNSNFTAYDYDKFFNAIENPIAYEMWSDAKKVLDNLEHPGVDVYCITGKGAKTLEGIDVVTEFLESSGIAKSVKTMLKMDGGMIYGDGDGKVNAISADRCLEWQTDFEYNFYYKSFDLKHLDLVKTPSVMEYLFNIITNMQYV